MFKLPNGKIIEEEDVIKAMEDSDIPNSYFLDTKTGKVKKMHESDENHFIKIPKISKQKLYLWMKEYTDEFINREDPEFAKEVYVILKQKNVFDKYERTLEKSEEGWIHGWAQWERDCVYEEMQEWFLSLPITIKEEWDYFDDCAICQEMKKADEENRSLTETELKKAFVKAKEKGAIVGGHLENKSKSIN